MAKVLNLIHCTRFKLPKLCPASGGCCPPPLLTYILSIATPLNAETLQQKKCKFTFTKYNNMIEIITF